VTVSDRAIPRESKIEQRGEPKAAAPADVPQPGPGSQAPEPQVPNTPSQGVQASGPDDTDAMIDLLVRFLPPVAAVVAALTQSANLWLAGLVVRTSGRLRRPWPDIAALSFPPVAVAAFGVVLGGSLLPGLPGLFASLFAATLTIAFALVGFAVMHTLTRGMRARAVTLWGAYLSVLFLLWPVVPMTIIGVTETLFGLRGRFSQRGPPAHNT
jgi:hypothetical protein